MVKKKIDIDQSKILDKIVVQKSDDEEMRQLESAIEEVKVTDTKQSKYKQIYKKKEIEDLVYEYILRSKTIKWNDKELYLKFKEYHLVWNAMYMHAQYIESNPWRVYITLAMNTLRAICTLMHMKLHKYPDKIAQEYAAIISIAKVVFGQDYKTVMAKTVWSVVKRNALNLNTEYKVLIDKLSKVLNFDPAKQ